MAGEEGFFEKGRGRMPTLDSVFEPGNQFAETQL
jgi:hypothetical protein